MYGSAVGQIFTRLLHINTKPTLIACDHRTREGRTTIEIYVPYSDSSSGVYMGDDQVTASTGIPINNENNRVIPVNRDARIYLIADVPREIVIAEYTP